MTASELIEHLTTLIKTHGDKEVETLEQETIESVDFDYVTDTFYVVGE